MCIQRLGIGDAAQRRFERQPILSSIKVVASIIIVLLSSGCNQQGEGARQGSLTVVSYGGGEYQLSHKQAFCEPFSLYTGMPVQSVVWNAEFGKLKAMVESGRVTWDVVDVTAAQYARGVSEGLFEQLPVKPPAEDFLPNSVDEYGVASVYWGTVLAYRANAYPQSPPRTWKDFFDVENFPGSRAMYDDPRGNLEFALLADGVELDRLYPLDVNRAFNKLSEIKPLVRVWWKDGTQPVQLLLNGTVEISSVWNGRIFASEQARESLDYSWVGAALELDYWVIPFGSRHVEMASRFITYASSAYPLARQTQLVGYGPVNRASMAYIDESIQTELPTYPQNWESSFVVDAAWWAENELSVKTRWLAWKNK